MQLPEKLNLFLESHFINNKSVIYQDLATNFKQLMSQSSLSQEEAFLNLLAIASALSNQVLTDWARGNLDQLNIDQDLIQEAGEIAAMMAVNNVYFKFKSFLPTELVEKSYARSGLRANAVVRHLNTKKDFELMALAVSAINGCAPCVQSHEKTLREQLVPAEKIHDVARLAAITKGLDCLLRLKNN